MFFNLTVIFADKKKISVASLLIEISTSEGGSLNMLDGCLILGQAIWKVTNVFPPGEPELIYLSLIS